MLRERRFVVARRLIPGDPSMKALHVGLCVLGLSALTLAGCTRESEKGGPGAKATTTKTTSTDSGATITEQKQTETPAQTFSIEVPRGGTNVTQGKSENVTVSIDRGDTFKQAVTLTFKAPAGVKVTPAEAKIGGSDTRVKVGIEAAPDATPGRHSIHVIGTPETGKATSVKMDVDVKKS
jgi:hypothetical protein